VVAVSLKNQDGRLAALNVSGLPVVRQWFVVKQQRKRLLPAAQALWDFFATEGRDFLPALVSKRA
jgi:LysR family transcriptional regulator for metE and metH